jgi:hypothetical protein
MPIWQSGLPAGHPRLGADQDTSHCANARISKAFCVCPAQVTRVYKTIAQRNGHELLAVPLQVMLTEPIASKIISRYPENCVDVIWIIEPQFRAYGQAVVVLDQQRRTLPIQAKRIVSMPSA